jgi:hypothetical protein
MTEYTFKQGMTKLLQVYGEKSYPKARLDSLYSIVKDSEDMEFMSWCERVVAEERYAPMGKEFREFATVDRSRQMKKLRGEILQRIERGEACRMCGDDGRVLARNRQTHELFAFLCPKCKYAEANGYHKINVRPPELGFERMATWSDSLSDKWEWLDPILLIQSALIKDGQDARLEL